LTDGPHQPAARVAVCCLTLTPESERSATSTELQNKKTARKRSLCRADRGCRSG